MPVPPEGWKPTSGGGVWVTVWLPEMPVGQEGRAQRKHSLTPGTRAGSAKQSATNVFPLREKRTIFLLYKTKSVALNSRPIHSVSKA